MPRIGGGNVGGTTGGGGARPDEFAVDAYGADPTGAADSTAAFVAARNAAIATLSTGKPGATIRLGVGNYKVTAGQVDITDPRVEILGPGASISKILGQGTGSVIVVEDAAWVANTEKQGRRVGGFTIDGTGMTGAGAALEYRDINSGHLDDLNIDNFPLAGSIGIWFRRRTGWSERTLWTRVRTRNCADHVVFDGNDPAGGSFMYHRVLQLASSLFPGQRGLVFTNFAQFDQCVLNWNFNNSTNATTARSCLITVGTTATDNSRIRRCHWAIQGEKTSNTSPTADIDMSSAAELNAFGTFWLIGTWTAGTATNRNMYVAGQTSAPVFGKHSFQSFPFYVSTGGAQTQSGTRIQDNLVMLDQTGADQARIHSGAGDPNGARFATPGSLFLRTGAVGTSGTRLYVNTGTGSNSVWTALAV